MATGNIIPTKKYDRKAQWLQDVFSYIMQILKRKNKIDKQGILLFADHNGHTFAVLSNSEVPAFLQIGASEYQDWSIETIGNNTVGLCAKNREPAYVDGKDHFLPFLKGYHSGSIPIYDNDKQVAAILGYLSPFADKQSTFDYLDSLSAIVEIAIEQYKEKERIKKEAEKKEALLTISQTLYSSFDVYEVLSEAINSINLFYPNDRLELYMTQDYIIPDLPIKQMAVVPDNDDIIGKAFLEGRLIIKTRREEGIKGELAVPLKGRQGVYGVIHLICQESCEIQDEKVTFISNIADILSSAFENAQLYQQSLHLVKELQMVNELTKRLNQSLNKDSILQFVIKESIKLFNANYVCIFKVNATKEFLTVIASNDSNNIGISLNVESGYMGLVYKNKEPIIISDILSDKDIEDSFIQGFGCRSLISVPILVDGEIIGILSVSSKEPYYFSYDNFKMLQLFAQHLGLTLTNALLHEKIQHLAVTDYLTGLYNRSYLDDMLKKSIINDSKGSILLFDIDNFKKINDNYGHQTGDKVLVKVAEILKTSIREADVASRWGGEEMALYLPRVDIDNAVQIAERILDRVRTETEPRVTISCGIAVWDDSEENADNLIRKADKALYEAKNSGKDRVKVFK